MIEWLAVMAPLVLSPGLANIVAAISGTQVGLRRSISLLVGMNVVYLSSSLMMGFGVSELLITYPILPLVMKYAGVLFIAWLGISIWCRSKTIMIKTYLGFKSGIVLQFLNPKFPIVLIVMYSTFLNPANHQQTQVFTLSPSLLALNIVALFLWTSTGVLAGNAFKTEQSRLIQDRIAAAMYVLVGFWIGMK